MINEVICNDVLIVLKELPTNSIPLIIADPPFYLLNVDWDKKQWVNQYQYLQWCKEWFIECNRVLTKDGSIYVFQNWHLVAEFVIELKKIFPIFRNWITWERIKGRSSSTNFKSSKEEILYFCKSNNPTFNEQHKIRPVIAPYRDEEGKPKGWFIDEEGNRVRWTGVGNVWHYTPPVWSSKEEKPEHCSQKPLMLIERIIESSSNENNLVLDLFSGSGTTAVACKKLNRNFISIEKNPEFCKIIERRLYGL